jgi:hypothetical protein
VKALETFENLYYFHDYYIIFKDKKKSQVLSAIKRVFEFFKKTLCQFVLDDLLFLIDKQVKKSKDSFLKINL